MKIHRFVKNLTILILKAAVLLNCTTSSVGIEQSQLIDVVTRNDVAYISNLEESFATDWRNGSGWSLLHLASFYAAENVTAYLIEAGADLAATNSHGETSLHLASMRGHVGIIKLITTQEKRYNSEAGKMKETAKKVNQVAQYLNELSRNFTAGLSDISLDETLQQLSRLRQSADKVEKIIRRAHNEKAKLVSLLEAEQSEGKTPLFYALNSTEARSVLVDLGANLFHRDKQGMLPIHEAAIKGNVEAISFFSLENFTLSKIGVGDTGKTISHLAAEHNFINFSMVLFDPLTPDALGQIPACWAAINGSLNFAKLMIGKSHPTTTGDCVFGQSYNRRIGSPLHVAAYYRHKEYINLLLDHGVNQTARDSTGGSTLHAMALRESIDIGQDRQIVELLKNQTSEITQLLDNSGKTPFLVAADSSSLLFAKHLHEAHGIKIDSFDYRGYSAVHLAKSILFLKYVMIKNTSLHPEIRTRDSNELTVFLAAVQQKHPVDYLRELITDWKSNTKAVSNKGQNAVHIAVQANHTKAIRLFLHLESFDFSLKDQLGQTPLHLAIKLNTTEIALLIIDYLNATMSSALEQTVDDETRNTPLHLASENGNVNLMRMLLSNASDQTAILNSKNQTALHLAVANNHLAAVKFLLQNILNASIKIQDHFGRNVLHVAASSCSGSALEIVKALRDVILGDIVSFLEATDVHQKTPIDIAVEHNCPEMFQILMDCFVNSSKHVERCLVKNKQGMTPIQHAEILGYEYLTNFMVRNGICPIEAMPMSSNFCDSLFELIKLDHVDEIKLLSQSVLNKCLSTESSSGMFLVHEASANNAIRCLEFILDVMPSLVEMIDGTWRQWTPMHYAADRGHLIAMEVLKSKSADIFSNVSHGGMTPIHVAVRSGHVEVAKYFSKLHPALKTAKDGNGRYPIHVAAVNIRKEVIEYFLKIGQEINVPVEDEVKYTCLHIAARYGQLELVQWMVSKGADVYAKTSLYDGEYLPVHLAALFGHVPVVKFFVQEHPALKAAKDDNGRYLIHIAAIVNQRNVIEYFLTIGQEINVPEEGEEKLTCLHRAAEIGNLELTQWMVSKGADVYAKTSRYDGEVLPDKLADDGEYLPVHLAAGYGRIPVLKFFIENYPALKTAKDGGGLYPIHYAAITDQKNSIEYFLTIGQDINVPDEGEWKRTCLHIAAQTGNLELIQWMVSKGADVWAKTSLYDNENMPVHSAAKFGNLPVVKFFVEAYPNISTSKNAVGDYPIHVAAANNETYIVEYLMTVEHEK